MRDRNLNRNLSGRLRRIEGQVQGIARMIENGRYCIDVLYQIKAADAALRRVGEALLANHLETCMTEAFESADRNDRRAKIQELVSLYRGMRAK